MSKQDRGKLLALLTDLAGLLQSANGDTSGEQQDVFVKR